MKTYTALKEGFGSEGLCLHCKHKKYCIGNFLRETNKNIQIPISRQKCNGKTEIYSATGKFKSQVINHNIFKGENGN